MQTSSVSKKWLGVGAAVAGARAGNQTDKPGHKLGQVLLASTRELEQPRLPQQFGA